MIRVLETGKNPTMRYLHRTHRMSVAWLHECFQRKDFELVHEDTSTMCADIYTKAFNDAVKWQHACELANIVDPQEFERRLRKKGGLDPPVPVPRPKKAGGTSSEWDGAPSRGYSIRGRRRQVPLFCGAYQKRPGGGDDKARVIPTPSTSVDAPHPPVSDTTPSFRFVDNFDPDDDDASLPDEQLLEFESDLSSCGGDFTHFPNSLLAELALERITPITFTTLLRTD